MNTKRHCSKTVIVYAYFGFRVFIYASFTAVVAVVAFEAEFPAWLFPFHQDPAIRFGFHDQPAKKCYAHFYLFHSVFANS